jgi:hypothetical protein
MYETVQAMAVPALKYGSEIWTITKIKQGEKWKLPQKERPNKK